MIFYDFVFVILKCLNQNLQDFRISRILFYLVNPEILILTIAM
jgi:hypothetical protein